MEAKEKWDQLTEQHREQLLERYRDVNVHHGWWDGVYEAFEEDMGAIGVHVEAIYFSGFWSQGDGACFNGHVCNWRDFLTATKRPELIEIVDEYNISFSWSTWGRYCHENMVEFGTDGLWINNPYDEEDDEVRHVIWGAVNGGGGPLYAASDDLVEFLRDKMRDLYRRLGEEYEHLTSDEVVTEYILEYEEDEIDAALEEQDEEEIASV